MPDQARRYILGATIGPIGQAGGIGIGQHGSGAGMQQNILGSRSCL